VCLSRRHTHRNSPGGNTQRGQRTFRPDNKEERNTCCNYRKITHALRYDTIRYDAVDLRALKSWKDGQLNLAHGTQTKLRENWKQKPSSSEEMVQTVVREGSPGGRSETTGVGFVKQVGLSQEWKKVCTWTVQLAIEITDFRKKCNLRSFMHIYAAKWQNGLLRNIRSYALFFSDLRAPSGYDDNDNLKRRLIILSLRF